MPESKPLPGKTKRTGAARAALSVGNAAFSAMFPALASVVKQPEEKRKREDDEQRDQRAEHDTEGKLSAAVRQTIGALQEGADLMRLSMEETIKHNDLLQRLLDKHASGNPVSSAIGDVVGDMIGTLFKPRGAAVKAVSGVGASPAATAVEKGVSPALQKTIETATTVAGAVSRALPLAASTGAIVLTPGDTADTPAARTPYDPVKNPNLLDRNGAIGSWILKHLSPTSADSKEDAFQAPEALSPVAYNTSDEKKIASDLIVKFTAPRITFEANDFKWDDDRNSASSSVRKLRSSGFTNVAYHPEDNTTAGPATAETPSAGESPGGVAQGTGGSSGPVAAPVEPSAPYTPGMLLSGTGSTADQYNVFKKSVAGIEHARYNQMGGSSNRFAGRYQMGRSEIDETARKLGVPSPSTEQFLNDPQMQERFFEAYTTSHHEYLMRTSEQYRRASPEEKMAILGYAHNQGAGGAAAWLRTGQVGSDANGTAGTRYSDAIRRQLAAPTTGQRLSGASTRDEIDRTQKRSVTVPAPAQKRAAGIDQASIDSDVDIAQRLRQVFLLAA